MTVASPEPASTGQPPRSETIEELFGALESPLLSYALRLVGDLAQAEDIVQDAFMKLHAQFAEVREPRRWLYRSVHNLALNHRRQSGKIVALPGQSGDGVGTTGSERETADTQPLPDEQIIRCEGIGLVRLSLSALDERSREIVRLKFDEELSYRQIAERTALTTGHVGYLLHHALKALAVELNRAGLLP